jgi:CubicO group peptidase (beta-lactamase class C family)
MNNSSKLLIIILSTLLLTLLAGCNSPDLSYQVPISTDDGWTTSSLADVGMFEEPIQAMLSMLGEQDGQDINSILIVKDGKLVLETYFPGEDIKMNKKGLSFTRKNFNIDTLHCLASASKSITSILFGIAVDQGAIIDLDEKLFAIFPEYSNLNVGSKSEITVRQLLTMTSGFTWDEETYDYADERNDLNQMYFNPDPIRYMLEKPMASVPGEDFFYNSGVTNLLGYILDRKTGIPMADYAGDNLFSPLGITSYEWLGYPNDPQQAVASSLLYMKPRDMAKIGLLFLQKGVWNGKQIVSSEWVTESTDKLVQLSLDDSPMFQRTGYGYQWWRGQFSNAKNEIVFAGGWGGQFIFIIPETNMVVVFTGSDFYGSYSNVYEIVNRYILGSIDGYPKDWGSPRYGVTINIPVEYEVTIYLHSGPGNTYPVVGELEKGVVIYPIGFWIPNYQLEDAWLQISPSEWVELSDVNVKTTQRWLMGNLAELPEIKAQSGLWSILSRYWPVWLMLILLSLVYLFWRLFYNYVKNWREWSLGILLIILLGPFGLLIYFLVQHRRFPKGQKPGKR